MVMLRALTGVIVLGGAVLGCERASGTLHHHRDPGALVVARASDIAGLDLVRVDDSESIEVGELVFEGLTRWKPGTTELEPGLATSWEVSADGRRWQFALRPGVVFHDGTPLDAAAVVFSFERVIADGHPSYIAGDDSAKWRRLLMHVRQVRAVGTGAVEIEIARPHAPLLGELANFPIVSPAAVRRWGAAFPRHPVGTGAFEFERWDRGEQVVVKRFEGYWGARPRLDRIVFRVVVDARQRLVDLQSGSVDMAAALIPDVQSFVELHPELALLHAPSNEVTYVAFNMSRPPFDDLRVRRAICHAINKEPIVKLAYQGRAIAADGPLPPTVWGRHVPETHYSYDLPRARELLDQAARDGAFDPERVYKLFAPSTPRSYLPEPERVVRYLQAGLVSAGIKTDVVLAPIDENLAAIEHCRHDLALAGWTGDTGDPDNFLYVLFHGDNAVVGSAQNISFYNNPVLGGLLIQAQAVLEEPARSRLYAQAQDILAEDAPWLPLAHAELVIAVRAELGGVALSPLGRLHFPAIYRKEPR